MFTKRFMPKILVASIIASVMRNFRADTNAGRASHPSKYRVRATKGRMGHTQNPAGSKIARKLVGKQNWDVGMIFHGGSLTRNTQAHRYAKALQSGETFNG